jgi:hypothetical protein
MANDACARSLVTWSGATRVRPHAWLTIYQPCAFICATCPAPPAPLAQTVPLNQPAGAIARRGASTNEGDRPVPWRIELPQLVLGRARPGHRRGTWPRTQRARSPTPRGAGCRSTARSPIIGAHRLTCHLPPDSSPLLSSNSSTPPLGRTAISLLAASWQFVTRLPTWRIELLPFPKVRYCAHTVLSTRATHRLVRTRHFRHIEMYCVRRRREWPQSLNGSVSGPGGRAGHPFHAPLDLSQLDHL